MHTQLSLQQFLLLLFMEQFITHNFLLVALGAIWAIPWKGVALWKSVRLGHKWWFVALLVVNTLGVLDILYIFVFSKKTKQL